MVITGRVVSFIRPLTKYTNEYLFFAFGYWRLARGIRMSGFLGVGGCAVAQ